MGEDDERVQYSGDMHTDKALYGGSIGEGRRIGCLVKLAIVKFAFGRAV